MFGYHVERTGRPIALAIAEEVQHIKGYSGAVAVQLYTHGPKGTKCLLKDHDRAELTRFFATSGVAGVIHGSYSDNPWRTQSPNSIANIVAELEAAVSLGLSGTIVHMGTHEHLEPVVEAIAAAYSALELATDRRPVLWLETNAAKASESTYETYTKLQRLFERLAKLKPLPFDCGLCVDTAHLWACGVDLGTRAAAEKWFGALDALGEIPMMLHLNDSAKELGRGADKHASLCTKIWADYHPEHGTKPFVESGLAAILDWALARNVMVILEQASELAIPDLALLYQQGYIRP